MKVRKREAGSGVEGGGPACAEVEPRKNVSGPPLTFDADALSPTILLVLLKAPAAVAAAACAASNWNTNPAFPVPEKVLGNVQVLLSTAVQLTPLVS